MATDAWAPRLARSARTADRWLAPRPCVSWLRGALLRSAVRESKYGLAAVSARCGARTRGLTADAVAGIASSAATIMPAGTSDRLWPEPGRCDMFNLPSLEERIAPVDS